jgi:hypothetical protein
MLLRSLLVFGICSLTAVQNENVYKKGLTNLFQVCYDEYGCFTSLPPFGMFKFSINKSNAFFLENIQVELFLVYYLYYLNR